MQSQIRIYYAAPILLAGAAYVFYLLQNYSILPALITTHYDILGHPNGWMKKSVFSAVTLILMLSMVVLGIVVVGFVYGPQGKAMIPALLFGGIVGLQIGIFREIINTARSSNSFSFAACITWCVGLGMLSLLGMWLEA